MHDPLVDGLSKLLREAEDLNQVREFDVWVNKVAEFVRVAVNPVAADDFRHIYADDDWILHALRIGHVQGLIAKIQSQTLQSLPLPATLHPAANAASQGATARGSDKVFLVHGHDSGAKETVARFLEKLKLRPIILHEQPNAGRTIIEKFETFTGDVGFAVVLLTPDDFGGSASEPDLRRTRARQNVVMELGYFMGKLGRSNVCAIYKGDVELPSDYQGVLYIELDAGGAWKVRLAQELIQATMTIDLTGLTS